MGAGVTAFKRAIVWRSIPSGIAADAPPVDRAIQSMHFADHLGGAFAEYIDRAGRQFLSGAADMDFEPAALLEPFGTGLHGVEQSCLKAGDSCRGRRPGPIGLSVALRRARMASRRL